MTGYGQSLECLIVHYLLTLTNLNITTTLCWIWSDLKSVTEKPAFWHKERHGPVDGKCFSCLKKVEVLHKEFYLNWVVEGIWIL